MKLLFLTTEKGWRGGEVQLSLLAGALADRGHRVWVASPKEAVLRKRLAGMVKRPDLTASNDLDLIAAVGVWSLFRKVKPDVVHAFTPRAQALTGLAPRGKARLVASRLTEFEAGKGWGGKLKYRGVDAYVAVSQAAQKALERAGVPPAKVRVIHDAVGPAFRARAVAPSGSIVGCVAALVPGKGHGVLLEAIAKLAPRWPTLELRLIGDGPLRGELLNRSVELGIASRVQFLGTLRSPEEVATALAELDLFALPSEAEGLSTAILEAMAVGVAVVATSVGGIPENVRDRVTGRLVPPKDAAALATVLDDLLGRPKERSRLAAGARAVAEAHAVSLIAPAYDALYEELTAVRPAAARR